MTFTLLHLTVPIINDTFRKHVRTCTGHTNTLKQQQFYDHE